MNEFLHQYLEGPRRYRRFRLHVGAMLDSDLASYRGVRSAYGDVCRAEIERRRRLLDDEAVEEFILEAAIKHLGAKPGDKITAIACSPRRCRPIEKQAPPRGREVATPTVLRDLPKSPPKRSS